MLIAVISADAGLSSFLKAAGYPVLDLRLDEVYSLTKLVLDRDDLSALVIQNTDPAPWSAAHLLAAAKHLHHAGPTILVGNGRLSQGCQNTPFVSTVCNRQDILTLLRRPSVKTDPGQTKPTAAPLPEHSVSPAVSILPLSIPTDKILLIGVLGSQQRIGCTTQSISLWHYLRALGFDPAIVAGPAQISDMAAVMDCRQIDGGYIIDGVPFVSNAALAYDCYLFDFGLDAAEDGLIAMDLLLLVAGGKPWELQHSAAAARAVSTLAKPAAVILSFVDSSTANTLQPLFGTMPTAAAPWISDPWQANPVSLLLYDSLLRNAIENAITHESENHGEHGIELLKEVH